MKTKLLAILVCLLIFGVANAGEKTTTNKGKLHRNHLATSNYYSELTSGAAPQIAELNLFTNMLPKGGDLHHHYSGAIYAETYLDWVGMQNYCIYRESNPELKVQKYHIETKPAELSEAARKICISADATRKDNAFYRELLKHWSDKDYNNHYHEQSAPDQQFFDTFGFFGPVSNYSYHDGLQSLKERAIAENVQYLETMLKAAPDLDNPDLARKLNALNVKSSDQQIAEALTAFSDFLAKDPESKEKISNYVRTMKEAAEGIDDANFKLRFQSYVSRNSAPATVFSGLYSSFSAAKASKLVVGVNIVGPENGQVAMRDYTLHMKMFRFLKQRFPGVKLSLHAGELALGMVPPEGLKRHIDEALQIADADRIGHGVDISHETNAYELLDIMKKRKIAVEVNLTSNAFILGVKNEAHPVLLYRQHNVPFVISTDDAGVSRNNLSNEYLLYASRYKPSYGELKRVVYNSIRYSFLSEHEKRQELLELDKRFAAFEEKIATIARSRRGRDLTTSREHR